LADGKNRCAGGNQQPADDTVADVYDVGGIDGLEQALSFAGKP
jgi:hypothetical protein